MLFSIKTPYYYLNAANIINKTRENVICTDNVDETLVKSSFSQNKGIINGGGNININMKVFKIRSLKPPNIKLIINNIIKQLLLK
ncbi:MAG: hypothetical protein GYA87_08825 [Christensenellaceae bacterium]|nr:hypothetical protein [Christensenellaceae bacterium]